MAAVRRHVQSLGCLQYSSVDRTGIFRDEFEFQLSCQVTSGVRWNIDCDPPHDMVIWITTIMQPDSGGFMSDTGCKIDDFKRERSKHDAVQSAPV